MGAALVISLFERPQVKTVTVRSSMAAMPPAPLRRRHNFGPLPAAPSSQVPLAPTPFGTFRALVPIPISRRHHRFLTLVFPLLFVFQVSFFLLSLLAWSLADSSLSLHLASNWGYSFVLGQSARVPAPLAAVGQTVRAIDQPFCSVS